jgi:hypothetical protein
MQKPHQAEGRVVEKDAEHKARSTIIVLVIPRRLDLQASVRTAEELHADDTCEAPNERRPVDSIDGSIRV